MFDVYENELCTPGATNHATTATTTVQKRQNAQQVNKFVPTSSPPSTRSATTIQILDSIDVCCVPSCRTTRHSNNLTLHTIPRRLEQLQKWCHNLRLDASTLHKGMRVCSAHFEPYCIGGCMRPFAVPTLNLGHNFKDIYRNPAVIKKLNIRETCCVMHCKRNRDRDHANLHRFPSNATMLAKWCANLHKEMPDGSKMFNDAICEVHFEERCLRNKRLLKWALPTLNLGYERLPYQLPSEAEVAAKWPRLSPVSADTNVCCVPSCQRSNGRLYLAPLDAEVAAKWVHNLQLEHMDELATLRICALHFESQCFGKRLQPWAVPTLHLGRNVENLYENPEVPSRGRNAAFLAQLSVNWTPRCCLPHCRKTRHSDQVQLFRFPLLHRSTLFKWCHNLQLPLAGNSQRRLCSVHFEPHVLTKRCPVSQAVPTLQLNAPPGYKLYQNLARLRHTKVCSVQIVCILPSCRQTRADGCKLFRFPQNRKLLRQWTHNTRINGNEALRSHYRICSRHFEPNTFGSKRLHPGAVPTRHLGHDDPDIFPTQVFSLAERRCIVASCAATEQSGVRLYKFPSDDEALLRQWCHSLQLSALECAGARICSRHFAPECIGVKRLLKWAVPTRALGQPLPNDTSLQQCCVPDCTAPKTATFYKFPQSARLFHLWRRNLQLPELLYEESASYRICHMHYESLNSEGAEGKLLLTSAEENEEARCFYAGCTADLHLMHHYALPQTLQLRALWLQHEAVQGDWLCGLHFAELYEANAQASEALLQQPATEHTLAALEEDCHMLKESFGRCQQSQHVRAARCSVPHCHNNSKQLVALRLYAYPLDNALCQKWCHNTRNSVPPMELRRSYKVCAAHFEAHCFTEKRNLRAWALPTLQLPTDIVQPHALPDLVALWCNGPRHLLGPLAEKCCVGVCTQANGGGGQNGGMRYYNFPADAAQLQKWAHILQLDAHMCPLYKVCALHFEACCYVGARLRCEAVPTLHLGYGQTCELQQNPPYFKAAQNAEGQEEEEGKKEEQEQAKPIVKMEVDLLQVEEPQEITFKPVQPAEAEHEDEDRRLENIALRAMVKRATKSLPTSSACLFTPRCCVPQCGRQRNATNNLRTFGFPSNQQLYKKWCSNLRYEPSTKKLERRVCIAHFQPEVIGQRKLKTGAVPTLHLGHNAPVKYNNLALLQEIGIKMQDKFGEQEEAAATGRVEEEIVPSLLMERGGVGEEEEDDEEENEPCDISAFLEVGCTAAEEDIADQSSSTSFDKPVNTWSYCSLRHCGKIKTLQKHLPTFAFPKDKELLRKWCINLQLSSAECFGRRICIEHFEQHVVGTRRLRACAVPTLNLGHNAAPVYTMTGWRTAAAQAKEFEVEEEEKNDFVRNIKKEIVDVSDEDFENDAGFRFRSLKQTRRRKRPKCAQMSTLNFEQEIKMEEAHKQQDSVTLNTFSTNNQSEITVN